MSISNTQYDAIMRDYSMKQQRNRKIAADRQKLAYLKAPRLKEIEDAIASASVASARKLLLGDQNAKKQLQETILGLRQEKESILAHLGYPSNYLEGVYDCPDCKDTGYIGNKKCHCMKQAIIDTIYSQSNLRRVLEKENFGTFSLHYYPDDMINPATGLSALETIKQTLADCQKFIENFDNKPKNILFYGNTGVGKTFLSNCIAGELLKKGYSVVYFSAFQLFDILSKEVFDHDADAIAAHQNIFDCDLLIIDDLGTELVNNFTVSQLFLCINERLLRQKSTIISTNLGLNQLKETYSERTFSRIFDSYSIHKLFGDDIRLKRY